MDASIDSTMVRQSTDTICMVRPAHFDCNRETAETNAFQHSNKHGLKLQEKALQEFDAMVDTLRTVGVEILVVQDLAFPQKPDAIFPNNWFSTHADGRVVLYPMLAENRRTERLNPVIDALSTSYKVADIVDMTFLEQDSHYLEGTGSVVFDHVYKYAYCCASKRSNQTAFLSICDQLDYTPVYFAATDDSGHPIYHTNVLLSIGTDIAIVCTECITDEKENVVQSLTQTGKTIIEISKYQMAQFGGNALEVIGNNEQLLVMSSTAYRSLNEIQIQQISANHNIIQVDVPTIERYGGGSVRCMMAEIFLPKL